MPFVEVDGASLYYQSLGEGTPVLLSHGGGANSGQWFRLAPRLARRHRVLVVDHRGHGRSRCGAGELRIDRMAGDLRAVLDAAGVRRAALLGESMGGIPAAQMAVEEPDRVGALVLVSSSGGVTTAGTAANFARLACAAGTLRGLADPETAYLARQLATLGNVPDAGSIFEQLPGSVVEAGALERSAVPVLILSGADDDIFPLPLAAELAEALPAAEWEVLDGVGHHVALEGAVEAAAVVMSFLTRRAGWPSTPTPGGSEPPVAR